jgi:hypothetical protein
MATYLSGVTDYIPQFQPFQPDLNFYNNVLQTKQTQYDSNYKQLNKIYGNYFYADLTHGDNIQRKEELLKNIDVSLKKVSGLDLSLEQNVTQATQVFKPFYEDQYLMKDMAFTKNYTAQRNRAEGLKNSTDEEKRGMYWADGVAALDFQREEFKESNIGDTLNMANASYTNYINVQEKAMKLTKEAGLSIESVDFSTDGKYIVTTKNGEQLMEPLSKLLESQLGSDPAIQEVYRTQAYVNRKTYAAGNAAQFGGDKNAAEMKYLETNFNMLKAQQQKRYESLQDDSKSYESRIKDIQKQIDAGSKNPDLPKSLASLQQGKQINDDVLARIQKDNDSLKTDEKTATTTTGFVNPYGDIKSLRWKVDNAMASILMEKDLDESAQIFAFRDAKQSMVADPFAVSAQNHSYRMQEVASANASRERVAAINNAAADKRAKNTWDLSTGAYHYDTEKYIKDANGDDILNPNYNQVVPNESYSNTFSEFEDKDIATGEINVKNLSRTISQRQTDQYAVPYMQQSLALLDKLVTEGVMTKDQANKILHTEKDKTMTIEKFNKGLQGNSEYFLRNTVGTNSLTWINKKLNWWVKNNKSVSAITKDGIPGYSKANADFNNYIGYLDEDKKWRKDSSKLVEDKLKSQGLKNAQYLYKPDGTLRSEAEFMKVLPKESREAINNKANKAAVDYLTGFSFDKTWTGIKEISKIALATTTMNTAPAELAKALANLPVAQREAYKRKIEEAKKEAGGYEALLSAAGKSYSSATMKKVPPGISSIGEMSGAGVFTPSRQSINVAPLAFGTKGNGYFHEFARDFRKIDFATSGISFHGTSSTKDTDAGKAMINAMISAMNDTKSKFKPFKMSSQAIAGGSSNKGAMILHPDAEWLQNYMKSEKGTAGLITADDYNAILTNGISVVSDSKNWTNGLYTSSYLDPLQSVVESNPNGYEWNDPYGNYNMKIKKNTMGTGDYNIQRTYRLLNQETGQYEEVSTLNNTSVIGNNLSNVQRGMFNESEEVRTYNQGY